MFSKPQQACSRIFPPIDLWGKFFFSPITSIMRVKTCIFDNILRTIILHGALRTRGHIRVDSRHYLGLYYVCWHSGHHFDLLYPELTIVLCMKMLVVK